MGLSSTKPSNLPTLKSARIPFLDVFEYSDSSVKPLPSTSICQNETHRKVISDVHLKSKRDRPYEVEFYPRPLKSQAGTPQGSTRPDDEAKAFERQEWEMGKRDGLNHFAPYLTKLIETIPTEDLRSAELTWYNDHTGLKADLEWWNLNPRDRSKSGWKGTNNPFSDRVDTVDLSQGDISIPFDIGNLNLDDPQEMIDFSQRSHRQQLDADRSLLFNSRLTSENASGTEKQGYDYVIRQELTDWTDFLGIDKRTKLPGRYHLSIIRSLLSSEAEERRQWIKDNIKHSASSPINRYTHQDDEISYVKGMTNDEFLMNISTNKNAMDVVKNCNELINVLPFHDEFEQSWMTLTCSYMGEGKPWIRIRQLENNNETEPYSRLNGVEIVYND
ncbi:hypothetical protein I204_05413 [Kwoniella mangroviensis CBS 8886]|nr:hypothetical protein I204_05413 [Kwoniella mangroviensis CBS 8886]